MSVEGFLTSPGSFRQTHRKFYSAGSSHKDLWSVAREGSLHDIDSALLLLKKNGGNVDQRNSFGLTPLHIATWRNHLPMVKRLLAAGADPDARDGESGWSCLHRALHFGHLAVASTLLQSGASLTLEDSKCRIPVDLLSGPVSQVVGNDHDSVSTEVFSWGSGTNYQLGNGNEHIRKMPGKVDSLQDSCIKIIAASKFHSVAVSKKGELYTWGFGRGGRLGHPEFDIHSGQAAVITPRQVISGLGCHRVKAAAAAKHHTVIATESGDLFTWGSNREGQLGYTSVDTQPTPRRVSSLRAKVTAAAAGNKHTAVVTDSGEVYTWGCNKEGQLGYGTSNSASNYSPRLVEYLKGRILVGVSASKYHTVVLGADGEVFTWGHRLVTPKRVAIARNLKKSDNALIKFHRMERLHVISLAAGMVHTTALTDDGTLFYWVSSDPDMRCQQLYSLGGRDIVSISAGKHWTAAVSVTGDVYMWNGKKDETPVPTRLYGIKHATTVCIGETHLLALCALYHPSYPVKSEESLPIPIMEGDTDELAELDEVMFGDKEPKNGSSVIQKDIICRRSIPSLKSICEKVAAVFLVEPRNAIQLLEIADSLEVHDLKKYCEDIAIRNLDYIFTFSLPSILSASSVILANLEKTLDIKSSECWSHRCLPTPSAIFSATVDSEEEGNDELGSLRPLDNHKKYVLLGNGDSKGEYFLQMDNTDTQTFKQVRAIRKKLQQIEMLEAKQFSGHLLDDQQIVKLHSRPALENELAELGFPFEKEIKPCHCGPLDGKSNKKVSSRKQRRKDKHRDTHDDSAMKKYDERVEEFAVEISEIKNGSLEKGLLDVNGSCVASSVEDIYSPKPKNISDCEKVSQMKKKNRKGGLSMFLSGDLDDAPKHAPPLPPPPPPAPKNEGPAWGGVKTGKGTTSLRDIQNEQSKVKGMGSIPHDPKGLGLSPNIMQKKKVKDLSSISSKDFSDMVVSGSSGQISSSSFLSEGQSNSAAIASVSVSTLEMEKGTPPWSTSPASCKPSLRDIQMQQKKKHQNVSHSPTTRTSGFSLPSPNSPSESGGANRWFKPEADAPSSIRSIQIEERAIKDLKRFYSSVKLVKTKPS